MNTLGKERENQTNWILEEKLSPTWEAPFIYISLNMYIYFYLPVCLYYSFIVQSFIAVLQEHD